MYPNGPTAPATLPRTPEDAHREYRRRTRPFRRAFRGIITRREAERFVLARAKKTERAIAAGLAAANEVSA